MKNVTDTHIHASQYPNVGVFGKTTLMDWLNNYIFPIESSKKDVSKTRLVYSRCIQRSLSNGTTTAVYFATTHVDATNMLADLCLSIDISPETCIADTRATIEHIAHIDSENSLITPIITPRFAQSCISQMMYQLGALRREIGLPIQTHTSENQIEIDIQSGEGKVKGCTSVVHKAFSQCTSYAIIYDHHVLFREKIVLAHAVHLTEEETNLINLRQSRISHCPISNTALISGESKIQWLLKKGIDIGLGSDVSGVYETKLTVEEVLHLATRGGVKVVGLDQKLGAFEVGMTWDVQFSGLNSFLDDFDDGNSINSNSASWPFRNDGKVDIFSWELEESAIEKWVFNGDDRNFLALCVQGRLVHHRKAN
ncbi:putative guanine deaminase [Erysiphe neolycopersici]|uniref:Putative guanine deaminase n=1 Tax=Erysiphe neolycopersici TaxID=212602 RepID=A0A420HV76_9PEZI|nr:putative guanine deaminase [Erysiphe neolycopersici]